MTFARIAAALTATALMAGCVAGPPIGGPALTGIEGEWISLDGVAVSTFSGGQMRSTATDTGRLLSTGTYRFVDRNLVEVTIHSVIRQSTIRANCALVDRRQLNCTNETGQQFGLVRRA